MEGQYGEIRLISNNCCLYITKLVELHFKSETTVHFPLILKEYTAALSLMRLGQREPSMLDSTPQPIMIIQVSFYNSHSYCTKSSLFSFSAGPVIASPVKFQLLSHAHDYPPTFTVTCISSAFPPTRLEWSLNGSPLDLSSNNFSSSQQMRNATSSTYYNILTVSGASVGQYSCSVANDRGTNSANTTVNGRKWFVIRIYFF